MKKVFLVDDEILVRETIRDCVQWEKEGFQLIGDAPDGEVALPMIEELKPDILITDIKMPFMDGLELTAIVRKQMPDIKIIILSGHGEFEYARTALRMGVEEYCLKPVSASDIIRMLHAMGAKIDAEQRERNKLRLISMEEKNHASLTREKLLNDLCSGFLSTSDAFHLSASLGINLVARHYAVVISDYRGPEPTLPAARVDSGSLLGEDLTHPNSWSLPMQSEPLAFRRSRTETVWILKGDSPERLKQELDTFHQLQSVKQTPRNPASGVLRELLTIGIGSIQDRLQGIHVSFQEAQEDMHWRRLMGQNRHALQETSGWLEQAVFLDRSRFIEFLKTGTPEQASGFIPSYADRLKDIEWQRSPIGYYILNDLTLEVFRTAKDTYRHLDSVEDTLEQLQTIISGISSYADACGYLMKLTQQYWLWRSGAMDKYGDILVRVKEYIHLHYDKEQISLQDAADHVNLSPGHLSKIFSQETGQTFIEYVTQTRISKAMELLHTTNAKSYEIAFQVGYNDAHYFSNLFKRMTGMTTKEFRKKGLFSEPGVQNVQSGGKSGGDHR
jgi:two-component system, response regulator YesN